MYVISVIACIHIMYLHGTKLFELYDSMILQRKLEEIDTQIAK